MLFELLCAERPDKSSAESTIQLSARSGIVARTSPATRSASNTSVDAFGGDDADLLADGDAEVLREHGPDHDLAARHVVPALDELLLHVEDAEVTLGLDAAHDDGLLRAAPLGERRADDRGRHGHDARHPLELPHAAGPLIDRAQALRRLLHRARELGRAVVPRERARGLVGDAHGDVRLRPEGLVDQARLQARDERREEHDHAHAD
jgi:hypothetical protein